MEEDICVKDTRTADAVIVRKAAVAAAPAMKANVLVSKVALSRQRAVCPALKAALTSKAARPT
ncbi:hypothetical protein [Fictibacillus enclensis]|uniref:hypothetical protein n=1 Tax=Fictibacillus enclensis TaxID=1017270 RepID=UPI00259FEDD3|nr:hypothetical protein [Fictibacillus enclensis]